MTDKKTFGKILGENIKRIRQEKGLDRKDLAEKLGVTYTAIAGYENEGKLPTFEKVLQLAEIFDVSITDLTGENKNFVDEKIFEYRLQRAIDIATRAGCTVQNPFDDKLIVKLPRQISVEEGKLDGKTKATVTFDIGFAPILFDHSKDFVEVMETVEKAVLADNDIFIEKLRKTIFKPKKAAANDN